MKMLSLGLALCLLSISGRAELPGGWELVEKGARFKLWRHLYDKTDRIVVGYEPADPKSEVVWKKSPQELARALTLARNAIQSGIGVTEWHLDDFQIQVISGKRRLIKMSGTYRFRDKVTVRFQEYQVHDKQNVTVYLHTTEKEFVPRAQVIERFIDKISFKEGRSIACEGDCGFGGDSAFGKLDELKAFLKEYKSEVFTSKETNVCDNVKSEKRSYKETEGKEKEKILSDYHLLFSRTLDEQSGLEKIFSCTESIAVNGVKAIWDNVAMLGSLGKGGLSKGYNFVTDSGTRAYYWNKLARYGSKASNLAAWAVFNPGSAAVATVEASKRAMDVTVEFGNTIAMLFSEYLSREMPEFMCMRFDEQVQAVCKFAGYAAGSFVDLFALLKGLKLVRAADRAKLFSKLGEGLKKVRLDVVADSEFMTKGAATGFARGAKKVSAEQLEALGTKVDDLRWFTETSSGRQVAVATSTEGKMDTLIYRAGRKSDKGDNMSYYVASDTRDVQKLVEKIDAKVGGPANADEAKDAFSILNQTHLENTVEYFSRVMRMPSRKFNPKQAEALANALKKNDTLRADFNEFIKAIQDQKSVDRVTQKFFKRVLDVAIRKVKVAENASEAQAAESLIDLANSILLKTAEDKAEIGLFKGVADSIKRLGDPATAKAAKKEVAAYNFFLKRVANASGSATQRIQTALRESVRARKITDREAYLLEECLRGRGIAQVFTSKYLQLCMLNY